MKTRLLLLGIAFLALSGSAQNEKTLFFISNTHLDTQWNWTVETTIGEYLKNTLNQNMALMDKYPAFHLNFEAGIKYMWMKEYYPAEYEKMKQYIASGQWHVSGMSIDANDVMVSSAESILHSMLYGNRLYKKEFGVRGGYDIMLPDCFGFSYALPSLAKHAGIKGFHTQKLSWGSASYDQLPPFGIWQGVDGSQIYAIYKPGAYDAHEDFNKDMTNDEGTLSKINDNYRDYGIPATFRYVGPRSDHGGGLSDNASSSSENTPYWLNYSAQKTDGAISVKMATPDECFDYLAKQDQSRLKVWNDELPMRAHGVGSYTSRAELKQWNRRDELLADGAEKASSLAYWLGASYPDAIRDGWIHMLWQQHHDGITGTSISKAYEYSHNEYYLANKIFGKALTDAVGVASQYLDTNVEGTPIVVYNPLSHLRTDIVEGSMVVASRPEGVQVFDGNGQEVLAQMTAYNEATHQLSFIFAATVPSLGYAVYDVRPGQPTTLTSSLAVDNDKHTINNGHYRVTINKSGDHNLYDLTRGTTLVGSSRMQLIEDFEQSWPAWEISYDNVCRSPYAYVNEDVDIRLVEDGPLRKSFRVQRSGGGSSFVEYIRMSALSDRVDCVNEVDWQSRQTLLKANFPFSFQNPVATYDISLGTIERQLRNSDEYEVKGHQWADMSDTSGEYGVSILNDSKYGWDKPTASSLRLTLIHTPGCGAYKHQAEQDIGPHHFTYAMFPHEGNWSEKTQIEAARLNQPLVAFVADKHEGVMGRQMEFINISTDKVAVKAVKKAEDTDDIIVRVYEWTGNSHEKVTLSFPADIESAYEANAIEEAITGEGITIEGNTLSFAIGRYQPKTFAVKVKRPDIAGKAVIDATPLDLEYNLDLMSYDDNKADGRSVYAYLYPAEQIDDEVCVDGINFHMGPRQLTEKNTVRCSSSTTINVSRAAGQNKLYLLMASGNAEGTEATVTMGARNVTLNVPYFTGYAGQPLTPFNLGAKFCKENIALTTTHAHRYSDKSNRIQQFMYMYKYCVELPEGVEEVKISGSDSKLFLFAATVAKNNTDDIAEFTPINTIIDYTELGDNTPCGSQLQPTTVLASHQNGNNEAAKNAADGDITTKWCVTSGQSESPWLEYQFSEPVEVCSYLLFNAGLESIDWVTRDYRVQYFDEESNQWIEADKVTENIENKVEHGVTPFLAKKIRLQIDHGEHSGTTTRVYEFMLFGKTSGELAIQEVGTDQHQVSSTRKYIENGRIIIERAGKRFTANGQQMK